MKVNFMSKEEFLTSPVKYPYKRLFLKSLEEAAYCKTEFFPDGMFGILKIPDKRNLQGKFLIAAYYVWKGEVLFLDEEGIIYPVLEKLKDMEGTGELQELQILLMVFNGLIEDEVPYLQRIEERITELEDILIAQPPRDFPQA